MEAFHAQDLGTIRGHRAIRLSFRISRNSANELPSSIHVLPYGDVVSSRDGRKFRVSDLNAVIASSEMPILIDWEHRSLFGDTRAAGWLRSFESVAPEEGSDDDRAPGLWGNEIDWTDAGGSDLADGSFRFLSPVVLVDPETGEALAIDSVALTNRPALHLEELQKFSARLQASPQTEREGTASMSQANLSLQLCSLLGLDAGSSEEAILASTRKRVSAGKELCSMLGLAEDASYESVVRAFGERVKSADLAKELNGKLQEESSALRVENESLKTKLEAHETAAFEAELESVLEMASTTGKLTPAQAESWRPFASKSPEHLEQLKAHIALSPKVCNPAPKRPKTPRGGEGPDPLAEKYSKEELDKVDAYLARQAEQIDTFDEEN